MRKKGGKWPHLLSWKLATSENVFGARGWPVNGVNANEHNEGRGSANAPISSLRQSTTGSRLFFKPPSPSLPMSNSPCQESVFWEVTLEGFLGFVCLFVFPLVFSFKYELNFNSLSPVNVRISHVSVLPQVMILSFSRPVIWTLSHLMGSRSRYLQSLSHLRFPSPRRFLTLEKEVAL